MLFLLQNGADPSIRNSDNKTSSEIAKRDYGQSDIVSIIGNRFLNGEMNEFLS